MKVERFYNDLIEKYYYSFDFPDSNNNELMYTCIFEAPNLKRAIIEARKIVGDMKICAWCFPKLKEKNTSHTICKSCYEKMISPLWRWNPIRNKFEKTALNSMLEKAVTY